MTFKEIYYKHKNFTVVGFDKPHVGAAVLDFHLLQLLSLKVFKIVPNK